MGHDPTCMRCDWHLPESPKHCLWTCPSAHVVWRAICELLTRSETPAGFVTWGSVSWLLQYSGTHLLFEGEASDQVFSIHAFWYRLSHGQS